MSEQPFGTLCALWCEKVERARKHKQKVFGDDAEEAMRYLGANHDFQYREAAANGLGLRYEPGENTRPPFPGFQMTVCKVAEMASLFLPFLYHSNPYRLVRPRDRWVPPVELVVGPMPDMNQLLADPTAAQQFVQRMSHYQALLQQDALEKSQDAARAQLLERYLNYTPGECDLKGTMRLTSTEALVKGRGVAWTEVWQPPGRKLRLVSSFYDTVDRLLLDPDMESVSAAHWCARECVHPVWEVERTYGLAPGSLRGNLESSYRDAQVAVDANPGGAWARKQGESNDLIRYYKIYSKMGLGGRLAGAPQELRGVLDQMDYVYLVVAKDVPYPLNLPPRLAEAAAAGDVAAGQQFLQALSWHTPFWADSEWPFTELDFHPVPRSAWPQAHVAPGMGFQKFLNYAYSFLANKVYATSRDFIAVLKEAAEEVKAAIQSGGDLTLIEVSAVNKTIKEVVEFLQHPPMNRDMLEVVDRIENQFERATGVTEMLSLGQTRHQLRSAQEALTKREMANIRPDDMAEHVENFSTRLARKEAIAARYHLSPQDVAPVLGQHGAMFWAELVGSADLERITAELEYGLEAGSSRKPNKDRDIANTGEAAQVFLPVLVQWAQATGNVNALNAFMRAWAVARDMDPEPFLFEPPPPVAPPPEEAGGGEKKETQPAGA